MEGMGCVQSAGCMYKSNRKTKMATADKTNIVTSRSSNKKDVKAGDIKSNNRVDRYMCDICGQEGLTDLDMRSHVLVEHVENQINCPFCDLEGTTLEEMTLHVNSQHLDLLTPCQEDSGIGLDGDDAWKNKGKMCVDAGNDIEMESSEESSAHRSNSNINEQSLPLGSNHHVDNNKNLMDNSKSSPCKTPSKNIPYNPTDTTPKRARLFLEVPKVIVEKPGSTEKNLKDCDNRKHNRTPVSSNYSCPLCGWGTDSSEEITSHVNVAHLDAVTPTKSHNPPRLEDHQNNNKTGSLECPFCGWSTNDSTILENHVHRLHGEELGSPGSGGRPAKMTPGSPLLTCPICGMECENMDGLLRHVDGHFSATQTPDAQEAYDSILAQELQQKQIEEAKKQEIQEFDQLQEQYGMKGNTSYKKQADKNMERAVCQGQLSITDYYVKRSQVLQADATGVDDGHSCTKGIIESLHNYYKSAPAGISRYYLCSTTDHFASTYGDKGWGCGYRNLQMLLASMGREETYQQVLFNGRPLIPSLPKIQRLIETAWQKGFDKAGCEQLSGKVVNTSKWIGATEIVATLSSLKIKCQLIDFHSPTGIGSTHPRLFEWVRDYFRGTDKFKAPLYLQHQGHSRTIIGLEEMKDGSMRLLLFDPSCRKPQMCQFLQEISTNLMRTLRRPVHTLKAKQYQIVAVRGILTEDEYNDSKMLKSDQVP